MTTPAFSDHKARFDAYSAPFLREHASVPLRLKYEHTYKVLDFAEMLTHAEQALTGDVGRAVLLGALYHDIGRFTQFVRWGTFQDKHSTNHGLLGVRILKRENLLRGESATVQRLVLTAVGLHNRYHLPKGLAGDTLKVTQAVRDADKVDIFRIMATHLNADNPSREVVLSVRDEPDRWSPAIAECVVAGRVPSYDDLRYINDFRMLLASWLGDLNFSASRRELARSGHLESVVNNLPDGLAAVREQLLERLDNARKESA